MLGFRDADTKNPSGESSPPHREDSEAASQPWYEEWLIKVSSEPFEIPSVKQ